MARPGSCSRRIQFAALGRYREHALERIRGDQHEQQEADADHAHHGQHPGHELIRQIAAEQGNGRTPGTQQEGPQQQRSLVGTPDRGDLVHVGELGIAVRCHVAHGKIVRQKRPAQAGDRYRQKQELAPGGRARQRYPGGGIVERAEKREGRLNQGQTQGQDEGEMTDLGDH